MQIQERTLESGHVVSGTREYWWVKCTGCGNWFDSRGDQGRWASRNEVWCALCCATLDLSNMGQEIDRRPPPALMHVPGMYLHASLRDYPGRIETVAKRWGNKRKGNHPFVGIYGPSWSGKTRLAYAMAMVMRDSGRRPIFLHAPDARQEWFSDQRRRHHLQDTWGRTPALVIDAMTESDPAYGWGQAVGAVLDARTRDYMPTLIVTRSTKDTAEAKLIKSQWGEPFFKRLGLFEWINLPKVYKANRKGE